MIPKSEETKGWLTRGAKLKLYLLFMISIGVTLTLSVLQLVFSVHLWITS